MALVGPQRHKEYIYYTKGKIYRISRECKRHEKYCCTKKSYFPGDYTLPVGRGSVLGIGIRCRLDGPGRETFCARQTGLLTHPASYTKDTG